MLLIGCTEVAICYVSSTKCLIKYFQDKLGQLQALVMQLLGERQGLHNYQGNSTSPVANHMPHSTSPDELPGATPKSNSEGRVQETILIHMLVHQ